ncbi:MAG: CDP-alcohol phosphatidyltransferase family protein [Blastocatellia bacterium]|nr:CDP-alcohol phosphatidyltransferase family protein [Blastocatellia bacterium]
MNIHFRSATALVQGLTTLRLLLGPFCLGVAWIQPNRFMFAAVLVTALLTDIFDGKLARHLGVASAGLLRYDSLADSVFYVCAGLAIWKVHPEVLGSQMVALGLLIGMELLRYGVDAVKFRREASYHMWSAKGWGLLLFGSCLAVLGFGSGAWLLATAIWFGVVSDVEGLLISLVLPEWQHDVPSLWHACHARFSRHVLSIRA